MYKVALIIFNIFFLVACEKVAIRDKATYSFEVSFLDKALMSQNQLAQKWVGQSCCNNSKPIPNENCKSMIDDVVTVKQRAPYHLDMMRFLGGFSKNRPVKAPLRFSEESFCKEQGQ